MFGFVTSALPLASRSFCGAAVSQRAVRVSRSTVSMAAEMSKSVPFLLKPKNLDGLPAGFEFDPLLISNYISVPFLRAAEIKHGRICMLAALGMMVQELWTFPHPYFPHILPVEAHDYYIKTGGMFQIMMFIILFEGLSCYALKQTVDGKSEPGDFGFDPMGLGKDPVVFKKYQVNEIMNGRLAMIGVGGMIHQEWVNHTGAIQALLNLN